MKNIIITTLFLLSIAGVALGQSRIGYINSDAILEGYTATKAAEEKLRQFYAKVEKEATEKQQRIKTMEDELQAQTLILSEEAVKKLENEIHDSTVVYQAFLQTKLGQQGAVAKKQAELMKPIMDKINSVVRSLAEKENYDLVLDTKSGVVYGKPGYDLTEKVINILNKGK